VRKDRLIEHAGEHMPESFVIATADELRTKVRSGRWVLKPTNSSNASGIRFLDASDSVVLDAVATEIEASVASGAGRKWILQEYIDSLLVDGRKLHVRALVLVVGDMEVFLFKECRVLLATDPATGANSASFSNSFAQITNMSHNKKRREYNAEQQNKRLTEIDWKAAIASMPSGDVTKAPSRSAPTAGVLWKRIACICSDVFASLSAKRKDFFALPNCWEIFGLDFAVDRSGQPWLLEANPEPCIEDIFGQTSASLCGVTRSNPLGPLGPSAVPPTFRRVYKKPATTR
jgi:hypothetical protein